MMDLREPKKKKRVRLEDRPSLPVGVDDNGEWRVYTAHLSTSGTCIVDPAEMEAIYSMASLIGGFFGKGSLSRSFPSYGRKRFGVPPIVRNRQWVRRRQWLDELEGLNDEANCENLETEMKNGEDADASLETAEESTRKDAGDCPSETTAAAEVPAENGNDDAAPEVNASEDAEVSENSKSRDEDESEGTEARHDSSVEVPAKETLADDEVTEVVEEANREENSCAEPLQFASETTCDEKESPAKRARTDVTEKPDVDVEEEASARDDKMDVDEFQLDATEVRESVEPAPEGSPTRDRSMTDTSTTKNDERANDEETIALELLVLPDTDDDDTDNYLNTVKPRIEMETFPVNETLHLTFEETFFLMYGLGCLRLLYYDGSVFSITNAWNYFQQQDKYFVQKYIVYHYFRSKGWVVKPGMKFGGDLLLYKQGPPFYHASYIVVIEVMDADTLVRDDAKSLRKITWKNLIGLERLSETISKEILFAQILWPSTIARNGDTIPIETLAEFTVRELLWRRWNPKRKQDIAPLDEDDSDST